MARAMAAVMALDRDLLESQRESESSQRDLLGELQLACCAMPTMEEAAGGLPESQSKGLAGK